jgi:hypothetical protein
MADILATVKAHKWLFIGGAGAAGVGGLYLYEKHKGSGASVPAAAAYGYGAGAGYGYAYGYGAYGTAGFESPSGVGAIAPGYYYGYGPFAYGYGAGGGVGVGVPAPPAPQSATTNAQWAAAAQQSLVNEGFSSVAAAEALGEYITGQTLTSDQETIVNAAIAAENYPPVAGATGYPPAMHTSPQTGQGGGTTTSATQVTVPNVTKSRTEVGKARLKAAGFKVTQTPATTPKGKSTTITSQNPTGGKKAAKGSTVTIAVSVNK